MGEAGEIMQRNQFLHFELEGFWRDSKRWEWTADAIKDFFILTGSVINEVFL